jgi:cytochrome P450
MSSGVSYLVVFCALALHLNPDERAIVMYGNDQAFERFVQEVRRFYPFARGWAGSRAKTFNGAGMPYLGKRC